MRDITEEYKAYSKYRYEKAEVALKSAELLYENKDYVGANNRSYYSIFHSIRAVLALEHFDSKKHSGVIGEFNLRFVKSGKFDKKISRIIGNAFEIRNDSDYEDMFIASISECEEQMQNARYVLEEVKKFLIDEGVMNE